jgi:hypothetical protein
MERRLRRKRPITREPGRHGLFSVLGILMLTSWVLVALLAPGQVRVSPAEQAGDVMPCGSWASATSPAVQAPLPVPANPPALPLAPTFPAMSNPGDPAVPSRPSVLPPPPPPAQTAPSAPTPSAPSATAPPAGGAAPAATAPAPNKTNGDEKKNGEPQEYGLTADFNKKLDEMYPKGVKPERGFFGTLFFAYYDEFFPRKNLTKDETTTPERRGLPEPWPSPPFPMHEYQGYPLIGVPPETSVYPFMQAVYATPWGDPIKDSRIKFYGWVNSSGNWSTAKTSNTPASYWIVPNRYELDQLVFRLEREPDTVQQDHIDIGFRSTLFYGMDYRYTTAGGWFSDQLLKHNLLYGWDPIEQYIDVYVPWTLGQGMVIRLGRWVACPDIETQLAPDNYLGSHSILFTYDTYTQTGLMITQKLNDQWMVQVGMNAGNDMAPWYKGAVPSGYAGVRWVALDNNDAVYAVLNQINDAKFSHFHQYGQPLGHDNFNYFVATWEHRFTDDGSIHTKTEGYFMWERDAELGGTPSAGPVKPFGGGGGDSPTIPGLSHAYGVLNYTMFALTRRDYITLRNDWWKDESGFRSGFRGTYTSHTIGISHQLNDLFMVRPEIGYYRNWHQPAFDLGHSRGMWLYGFDVTMRF